MGSLQGQSIRTSPVGQGSGLCRGSRRRSPPACGSVAPACDLPAGTFHAGAGEPARSCSFAVVIPGATFAGAAVAGRPSHATSWRYLQSVILGDSRLLEPAAGIESGFLASVSGPQAARQTTQDWCCGSAIKAGRQALSACNSHALAFAMVCLR